MTAPTPQGQIIAAAQATGKLLRYRKTGEVTARPAVFGERVTTVIHGQVETTNRAGAGDLVVTGAAGEQYILSNSKFNARYAPTGRTANGERVYRAIGECWAVEYNGPTFQFTAPWGEPIHIDPGDYMCTTAVGSNDIYRIARSVFHDTYTRM